MGLVIVMGAPVLYPVFEEGIFFKNLMFSMGKMLSVKVVKRIESSPWISHYRESECIVPAVFA